MGAPPAGDDFLGLEEAIRRKWRKAHTSGDCGRLVIAAARVRPVRWDRCLRQTATRAENEDAIPSLGDPKVRRIWPLDAVRYPLSSAAATRVETSIRLRGCRMLGTFSVRTRPHRIRPQVARTHPRATAGHPGEAVQARAAWHVLATRPCPAVAGFVPGVSPVGRLREGLAGRPADHKQRTLGDPPQGPATALQTSRTRPPR